jgi:hypothetical protein
MTTSPRDAGPNAAGGASADAVAWRHHRLGWWSLLVFLTLGLVLEALHGFKVPAYLAVSNESRRLTWTLAHAHGTLLGLVNLAFASLVAQNGAWAPRPRDVASACLRAATVLLPSGFFLGGVFIHGGDPGVAVVLVPIAGLLLLVAVLLAALGLRRTGRRRHPRDD